MPTGEACKPILQSQKLTDASDAELVVAALAGNTQALTYS